MNLEVVEYRGFIYYFVCSVNGKVYFGQTITSLERRKRRHFRHATFCSNGTNHFHRAIRKYGSDKFEMFEFIRLESDSKEKLKQKLDWVERYVIDKYQTREFGYNTAVGGEGSSGSVWTEESKRKLSRTIKGRTLSDEHKRKISESMKGKSPWIKGGKWSSSYKKKMSKARKGNKNPMFGKRHSEESKRKMSLSHKKVGGVVYY